MKDFKALGVHKDFVKGLKELNIKTPTEIQEQIIPLLLQHTTDIIGQAQTGTGKTAAYGLPLLDKIDPNKKAVQGLILCPTRELGKQVAKQLFKYTKYADKIFTEAVYGGEHIDKQIKALERPTHIVVATPGRLIDLVNRKAVDLYNVKTVVLDEADEMLSMGFKKELDQIMNKLPNVNSKWLFSATMPQSVQEIIRSHIHPDAPRIVINAKNIVNTNISHQYVISDETEKLFVLQQFLKTQKGNQGIVFCRTKASAKLLSQQMQAKNIETDALHGDLTQKERDKVMRAFKNKKLSILVSTDVAARGIDVEGLTYVVHYQLPENQEYFTHRSGRTARAGKDGISLCLVTSQEVKHLHRYENDLKIRFTRIK